MMLTLTTGAPPRLALAEPIVVTTASLASNAVPASIVKSLATTADLTGVIVIVTYSVAPRVPLYPQSKLLPDAQPRRPEYPDRGVSCGDC